MPAEKKEKDIRWPHTNVKNVCVRTDIRRNRISLCGLIINKLNLKSGDL
jgi:hypothetical protein